VTVGFARESPCSFRAVRFECCACHLASAQQADDGVGVVDAAAPDSAAGVLEGGPEAGLGGQGGVGCEVGAGEATKENLGAFVWRD
jgi:hypothetical protein